MPEKTDENTAFSGVFFCVIPIIHAVNGVDNRKSPCYNIPKMRMILILKSYFRRISVLKKIPFFILCIFILLCSGCADKEEPAKDDDTLTVVTTVFPIYDWIEHITAGDDAVNVSFLLQNGVDPHSFQPSVDDIILIDDCDLFVYVGGESDQWIDDVIDQNDRDHRVVLNLIDILGGGARLEEYVEGMETDSGEEEEAVDEHVWLSLKNAAVFYEAICESLTEINPEKASLYRENRDRAVEEIKALDEDYAAAVAEADQHTVLFGDRFPFLYLFKDYHLDYYAAFPGCSAETEADFETIIFLADKVDELGLKSIAQIETSDGGIAETIRKTTKNKDQQILTFNSIQAVTAEDVENGADYLSMMRDNLNVLKKALR